MPEKEDQVRWKTAGLHTLHQLQDGLRLHSGREEAEPTQRVSAASPNLLPVCVCAHTDCLAAQSISKAWRTVWVVWKACCDYRVSSLFPASSYLALCDRASHRMVSHTRHT